MLIAIQNEIFYYFIFWVLNLDWLDSEILTTLYYYNIKPGRGLYGLPNTNFPL